MITTGQKGSEQFSCRRSLIPLISRTHLQLVKWFLSGLIFFGINAVLLFVQVDLLSFSVLPSTLIAAEICTLLRFFTNHYWVFGLRNPTLRECFRFHLANSLALGAWLVIANLTVLFGSHYQLAAFMAQIAATFIRLATDFLWTWRDPKTCKPRESVMELRT